MPTLRKNGYIFIITGIGGSRGGVPGARPLWDQILSFLHTFLPKSTHVEGRHPPPNGSTPPLWEILHPPLTGYKVKICKRVHGIAKLRFF